MPVKVSVNILAIVTAGLANEVEEVNQYPAVMNKATAIATLPLLLSVKSIVIISPNVAIISLISKGSSPLTLVDTCIISISKI